MSEITAAASWYVISTIIGAAGWLLAFRLLTRLPDRGLGFARIVGLLASGTIVWWGGTAGVLMNDQAGNISAVLIVLLVGLLLQRSRLEEAWSWLRGHWRQLLLIELLFLLSFIFWAFVRANSPEILGTEKPMELAFLNAISASQGMPTPDPWLSGYAISYYYFGFVIAGMLTQISGVAASIAFNLTSALWFALTVVGTYSVAYNLISFRAKRPVFSWPLLGPMLVVITGNLEGFLELLHSRQLFWRQGPEGEMSSAFWRWLDVKTLVEPPFGDPTWIPDRHWWWWRASRVVRDLNLAGVDHEVIDEFPFFSFLLADIHPHVLALPFALLAIAFSFQLLISQRSDPYEPLISLRESRWHWLHIGSNLMVAIGLGLGFVASGLSETQLGGEGLAGILPMLLPAVFALAAINFLLYLVRGRLPLRLGWLELLAAGWIFGALAFLNTWDFPIYLSLLFLVLLLSPQGLSWRDQLGQALSSSGAVLVIGVIMFLPWYPTFSSQAGGILPNLGFPTKIQHFVIMFGPLFVPIIAWLIWRQRRQETRLGRLAAIAIGLPVALWVLSWLLAGGLMALRGPGTIGAALDQLGVNSTEMGIRAALARRLAHPWTALLMGLTIALVAGLLLPKRNAPDEIEPAAPLQLAPSRFAALLVVTGALLVLGPEFLYLQDLFGSRMNTIFKFYFAGWILWGVAAAYVGYELRPRNIGQWFHALIWLPLVLGMFYPVMSLITRTQGFSPAGGRTLDGAAYLRDSSPADAEAIEWIQNNLREGVVTEAVGGSYSQYARISTHTWLSTVLGWEFHEIQWRGTAELLGSRKADIERLYRSSDWREARDIVERYDIDYVYIGALERSTYGVIREAKFDAFMEPIYQQGEVVIFAVPEKAETR
ncbi:MAG: DUF2298 domain-containing protein [Anaerolineales bacterium]